MKEIKVGSWILWLVRFSVENGGKVDPEKDPVADLQNGWTKVLHVAVSWSIASFWIS